MFDLIFCNICFCFCSSQLFSDLNIFEEALPAQKKCPDVYVLTDGGGQIAFHG